MVVGYFLAEWIVAGSGDMILEGCLCLPPESSKLTHVE